VKSIASEPDDGDDVVEHRRHFFSKKPTTSRTISTRAETLLVPWPCACCSATMCDATSA
jgi:hypothetical protein